jgi:hypothetical protein
MRQVLVCGFILVGLLTNHAARAQEDAARLDADRFSAGAPTETLLHVINPGGFAINAHSATGTALDLVDMITGPTALAGTSGSVDGRLDLLLDTGVYKIRLHPAAGAKGDVRLEVVPFTDASPASIMPHDAEANAALGDLQQRSLWFTVNGNEPVRIEAAGRALADFQLWRNGRDLVATQPTARVIEPSKGHPLRDILITGALPAGTYRATAYGGPALPWADGSPALPFHVREGASGALRHGWVSGTIGPFGSEVFHAAGTDDLIRLALTGQGAGPATLSVDGAEAGIDRKSRVLAAELRPAPRPAGHDVEITAAEGTPFRLRANFIGAVTSISHPGDYFVTANTTGLGGDEVPATLVLARSGPQGWTVAGSNAPELGPNKFWHHRFNLAGEVSLLFRATEGGKLAATITGVRLSELELTALDALAEHAPITPAAPGVWDIPAGYYALTLAPAGNSAGVADLMLAPPGVSVPVAPPSPPSPSISFGVQTVGSKETLRLFGNASPASEYGLDARKVPVSLDGAPLRVGQQAGEALAIPIQRGTGGAPASELTALEYGVGQVPVSYDALTRTAQLSAADHARLVTLFWTLPTAPLAMPEPEPEASRPTLHDGAPRFFDLAENRTRSFTLDVGAGGLFRVETLGRLHTSGAIGSHFVPQLDAADANGIGQNMLLQGFLRAGQYHVDVTASDSSGHAGIVARPARLLTTPALLAGGTVRATMPAGSALLVPVTIAKPGTYRIDLLGIRRIFKARLEDAQGWPFAASAPFDTATQDLAPGQYRVLVSPEAVDARAVARLTRTEKPASLAGHGPHDLPFEAPQLTTWREPAGRNDPRQPDDWRFALAAAADVTLSITDGMEASLSEASGHGVAHLVGGTPLTRRLTAGAYRVEARSQGRNDRLDYTLSLSALQLQPGVPRLVTLPASVPFAVAADRVVSLTSFGATPVRAVLKDAAGHVLERFGARNNDWNIALSRLLPAGSYVLELASAAPPPQRAVPANVNDSLARTESAADSGDQNEASQNDASPDEAGQDNAPQPDASVEPAQNLPAVREQVPEGDTGDVEAESGPAGETELTLSLPDEWPPVQLNGDAAELSGGGVQHLPLPQPAAGELLLAGAASAGELVLSLEHQAGGTWRSRAVAQGLTPLLAMPMDASPGAWRLSAFPVDGGSLPIHVAATLETMPAVPGQPVLQPAALQGVNDRLAVAHVALKSRDVVELTGRGAQSVLAGAWRGHQAVPAEAGPISPQEADLWLVAPQGGPVTLTPLAPGASLAMSMPEGARAALSAGTAPLTAWIAEAPGQPGLDAGHSMGVADGSALALAQREGASIWNAGGDDTLRVTARPIILAELPKVNFDSRPSWTLGAASAVPVTLPPGLHALRLDLPAGTAAIAGWPDPHAVTVWSGHDAVSRTIEGSWGTLLLVNTNGAPAPAGVTADALADSASLRPNHAERRFFGAAGSIDIPVAAAAGQTLVVAGDATATFVGVDGQVQRGTRLALTGPGRLILQHGAGLLAAWLEGKDTSPWPAPKPIAVSLPASLTLSGEAMQLSLAPASQGLLRIRSTAPVILALNGAQPELFPAGAAVSRYLAPGPASLRIIAPQDGGLSGTLDLTTAPMHPAAEGLGDAVAVAPGDTALFGFTLPAAAKVGVAVRAQPDDATLELLDASGTVVSSGAAMLQDLPPGHYVLSASVPRGGSTTVLRAAILGLTPRPNGPPPDTIQFYRELAGLTAPKDGAP